jgi:spermidine synthase
VTSATSATRLPVLYAVAALSGAAALLYQAVWLQWFRILFGNTAYAASATLCAFFAGLALGSALFGRVAERSAQPLRTYAKVEVVAAGVALIVPLAFGAYEVLYATLYDTLFEERALFVALKFGLALLVMLPPAVLLGGTFPLLATSHVRDPARLGTQGAMLYAVNTLGAAAGSAMGLLWLPEALGIRGTYGVAIGLSLAAAALAFSAASAPLARPSREGSDLEEDTAPLPLLQISFASGFGTLALEVLVIQAAARILDHSVYTLGSVMVVVLLALAAGAFIASYLAGRVPPRRLLSAALAIEAAMLLLLPWALDRQAQLGEYADLLGALQLVALLGGPPLLVGALVFPLTFELASGASVGRRVGGLLAANTLGAILGSLAASFVLLDRLGLWPSLFLLGIGYGVAWILSTGGLRARVVRTAALAAACTAVALSSANPLALPQVALRPGDRLLDVDESAYGVVSVVERPAVRRMMFNNHYILSGAGANHADKERHGHIPLLLHPAPRRALFVGSSTGGTAGAATLHTLDDVVLVELVPQVQQLAELHFNETSRHVYEDERTRVVVEDGRNHLRATSERYDVIVADLFLPWRPGVGSLFTVEHFEAVRARLTARGVFCQWIPLHQYDPAVFETAAATFLEVFPNATIWRSNFSPAAPAIALIGFAGAPPSEREVELRIGELAQAGVRDRWVTRPAGFWMFYMGALRNLPLDFANAARNRDNWPIFEFQSGRSSQEAIERFAFEGWPGLGFSLRQAEQQRPGAFGQRAAAGSAAGYLLAFADTAFLAGHPEVTRKTLTRLRTLIPPDLLTPPDPSAAGMWVPKARGRPGK